MSDSRTPQEVREAIESPDPIAVLDVRQSLDYVEGNVPESTWVPRRELERRLPDLVPNRSTPVVLCDERGDRADRDARWLESLGYECVDFLEGGIDAWRAKGFDLVEAVDDVHATAFNYESKEFGERVEQSRDLPKLDPEDVASRRDDVTVVDVRNPPEYERWGTVPDSVNIEGVDLALYADELRDDEPLVVHCAGRTRSIIGTATLQALGFENVYELENGTMGWELAGYELEEGSGRPDNLAIDSDRYRELRSSTEQLLEGTDVSFVEPDELERLEDDVDDKQSVYVFDVRTDSEFEDGHVPGSRSVAGGQLIQTAGKQIAVRDAEIVLASETHVRSAITAYWLHEMGFSNVRVLRGGIDAWEQRGHDVATGVRSTDPLGDDTVARTVDFVSPSELADRLETDQLTVLDVGAHDEYTDGHVPGSSWLPRDELERALAGDATEELEVEESIVLTCRHGAISSRAAAQVEHQLDAWTGSDRNPLETVPIVVLEGGVEAWLEAGHETDTGADDVLIEPRHAVRKPYAQGESEMARYLEWEESLPE